MRFHCGISFSWRTIKKILIPFLIGLFGCFGFNLIKDNIDNIPLGFIQPLQVSALENYYTRYDIDYSSFDSYKDFTIDINGTKLSDFIDSIHNNNVYTRDFTIVVYYNNNLIKKIFFLIFDNNSNYTFNLYGNNYANFLYKFTSNDSKWAYYIDLNGSYPPTDIYSTSEYQQFITCSSGGSCESSNQFDKARKIFTSSNSIDNDSNNSLYFDVNEQYVIYYSTFPLYISNTYDTTNSNIFYKSIYIDNESVDVGSIFPTYYDYSHQEQPIPTPTPTPIIDETNHKALYDKIYWFDDNTTELGVLTSIYELLFLYCITIILLKILTIIKNKRW